VQPTEKTADALHSRIEVMSTRSAILTNQFLTAFHSCDCVQAPLIIGACGFGLYSVPDTNSLRLSRAHQSFQLGIRLTMFELGPKHICFHGCACRLDCRIVLAVARINHVTRGHHPTRQLTELA